MLYKRVILFVLIFISLFILAGGCYIPPKETGTRPEIQWDGRVVTSSEIVSDTIVTCRGDLIIKNNGILTLNNVLLYMYDSAYGIYVESGGGLLIENNTQITVKDTANDHYKFWYKDGSAGKILDSVVEYAWTPDPDGKSQFNEAGIFLEADNFEVSNSKIRFSLGNGIEAFQADNLTINNTIFSENGANGILVRNSDGLSVKECIISNNGTNTERHDGCGMIVLVVKGIIDNCTIESNRFTGFEGSGDMNVTILNCDIKNNNDMGIFVHDEFSLSNVEIYNNTVAKNGVTSKMHAGISVEGAVGADVHGNRLDQNYIGIRVLNNTEASSFDNNTISDSYTWGIHVDHASPVFYKNAVYGCDRVAYVQDVNGTTNPNFGETTVEKSGYNDFSNNINGIRNDSSAIFKAENNYWGYTTDSGIDSYNFTDDKPIDYDPWLYASP